MECAVPPCCSTRLGVPATTARAPAAVNSEVAQRRDVRNIFTMNYPRASNEIEGFTAAVGLRLRKIPRVGLPQMFFALTGNGNNFEIRVIIGLIQFEAPQCCLWQRVKFMDV